MPDPGKVSIKEYNYALPEAQIALHPLTQRDASRLLIYKDHQITEDIYSNIATHLPGNSLLVFNNSKVINARLRFQKSNGGTIEIFCLEPYEKINEYSSIMNRTGSVRWKCFVGGASKWKGGHLTINNEQFTIKATMIEKLSDAYVIEFSWEPATFHFAEVIQSMGDIPLPPYIKRETEIDDASRYQTIYAAHDGSVAAPTAGLHFTDKIFKDLSSKNIEKAFITLHVGAGTFKPVKSEFMEEHEMHAEWIDVNIETINQLLHKKDNIIAVGTTSARTIESIYWLGVKCILDPEIISPDIKQWDVYESALADAEIKVEDALQALIEWMEKQKRSSIFTQTQLLIVPGYTFKMIKAIITNFHQPQSTLLLLVAAATNGNWKKIYDHALMNNFRFLSYGDGNLIFIGPAEISAN